MAYSKQNWNVNDVVSSEKMNHIEEGIYAAYQDPTNKKFMQININVSGEELPRTYTLSKTWKEIRDAMEAGVFCYIYKPKNVSSGTNASYAEITEASADFTYTPAKYYIYLPRVVDNSSMFTTNSENGYPFYVYEGAV